VTEEELTNAGWMVKVIVPALGNGNLVECWYAVGVSAKLDAQFAAQ
jgi:hypothetical protein